jgi:periplasmic protein TonB
MPGPGLWGVESERDMYYATKRTNNTTRVVGLVSVVAMNALVFWVLVSGFGASMMAKLVETQVAIIDQPKEEEPPPPPPPPVDVELPPPPPQVILPDFVFNQPPAPTAIQQVAVVPQPARPAEVRPPPPPAIVISVKPKPGKRFDKPEYPAASIRAQEQGNVTVSVCVDEQGRMTNVQLLKSSGFPRLDEATLKSLPKTRLDPAKGSDGKPIAMCNPPYAFTYVWNLEDAK